MATKVTAAASTGNRLDTLTAVRDRLAAAMDDPKTPTRDLAPLAARLAAITEEIERLGGTKEGTPLDTARRSLARRDRGRRAASPSGAASG